MIDCCGDLAPTQLQVEHAEPEDQHIALRVDRRLGQRVPQESVGAAVRDPDPSEAALASEAASMMARLERRTERDASRRRDLAQFMTGRFDYILDLRIGCKDLQSCIDDLVGAI